MPDIMELPTRMRVGPFDFKVVEWSHHEASGRQMYGEMSSVNLTVSIDESLSPIKKIDTLLHEIGHCIYWAYNLEDGDAEERIVATFATGWTQVWRDNPALLEWVGYMINKGLK